MNAASAQMVWVPDNAPDGSGSGSSYFQGYEGGEYVSSPVTGKVIDQDERCSIRLSKAYTFSNKNRMLSFEKSYDILKEINESFYYWVVSLPKLEEEKEDN